MHKKWTDRVQLTKKTSHSKSRVFLRKRRLKTATQIMFFFTHYMWAENNNNNPENCKIAALKIAAVPNINLS